MDEVIVDLDHIEDTIDHLSDVASGHRILLDKYNKPHMCLHMAALFLFLTGLCFCCFKVIFGFRRVQEYNKNRNDRIKFLKRFDKNELVLLHV